MERGLTLKYGTLREKVVLHPISGKAVPLFRGEVLRVTQLEGEQCVDFNAYNLHDYKEYMSVGATRPLTGFRPAEGDFLFSNPPRSRPMIRILHMPKTCCTDTLASRCSATLFEATLGFQLHTNCQDTLAEAIGEYDLTPDDVHDSFNMWMNSEWDSRGKWRVERNRGREGDYVDLLALFDLLAVPVTCGSGDVFTTSNFSFKPIQVEIYSPSPETMNLVRRAEMTMMNLKSQRTPDRYRVSKIKVERELRRNPNYRPRFVNYPIRLRRIEISLSAEEVAMVRRIQRAGMPGREVGEVIRSIFLTWYLRNRAKVGILSPAGQVNPRKV
jgi:uncharacterized protein YcgI (DUF1989 family)